MSAIQTQIPGDEPTGEIAYPFVLMEGDESAGKTTGALALARHPRINNTWAMELGESKLDQYKRIAPYRILRHNGTYTAILEQFQSAITYSRANPPQGDKVDLIIFDGGTALWDLEKRRVDDRAVRAAKRKCADKNWRFDPDAPVDRPFNLWADAKERWYKIMNLLREWEGIVVVTARGKETMVIGDDGKPVKDAVDWKVQTEGNLKFEVDAWIQMRRPHRATLVGCKALDVDVPENGILINDGNITDRNYFGPVAPVIFDMIGAGVDNFTKSTHVYASVGHGYSEGKSLVFDKMMRVLEGDEIQAKAEANALWAAVGFGDLKRGDEINDEAWSMLCAAIADKVGKLADSPRPPRSLQVVPQEPLATDNTPGPDVNIGWGDEPPNPAEEDPSYSPPQPPEPTAAPNDAPTVPQAPQPQPERYDKVPDDPEPAAKVTFEFESMSRQFSRLTPDNQETAMKWLRDNYECGPMAVRNDVVARVERYLDDLQPPPPPFTDADCTLARKCSKRELDELAKLLREAGFTGPARFQFLGSKDLLDRRINSLEGIRLNEWEIATKALRERLAQQSSLAS